MSLDRASVVGRIGALIGASVTPKFAVVPGEPIMLPADGSPFCAFWYMGRRPAPEGSMTLSNRMTHHAFAIRMYWFHQPEPTTLVNLETEIWQGCDTLLSSFWGDVSLNGLVDALDTTDPTVDMGAFPLDPNGRMYRTAEFDLMVADLEAEAIAR